MLPPQHSHRKKGSTNREQRGHKHQPFQYIFSGLLLLAGVAVVVSMTNVEVGCNDAVIVCKRSGLSCTASRAEIVVTQSFDITDGCTFDGGVSSVLDACAAAYANMADDEAENSTSVTFFTGDDDMRGEDEAEEEFFSALVANPDDQEPLQICTIEAYQPNFVGSIDGMFFSAEYMLFYKSQGYTVDEAMSKVFGIDPGLAVLGDSSQNLKAATLKYGYPRDTK